MIKNNKECPKRDNKRVVDSFKLIKLLVDNKDKLLKEGYISFSLKETFGDLYEILEKEYNENDFVWNTLVCSTNPDKLLELNLEDIELKGDYIIGDCDSAYKKII